MTAKNVSVNGELKLGRFDNLDDALGAVKRAHELGLRASLDTVDTALVTIEFGLGAAPQTIYDKIKAVQTLLIQVTDANA